MSAVEETGCVRGEWYLITLILTFSLEGEGGENRKKLIYEMTSSIVFNEVGF